MAFGESRRGGALVGLMVLAFCADAAASANDSLVPLEAPSLTEGLSGSLAQVPDEVRVPRGESIELAVPATASFLGGNDAIARLERTENGVSVLGVKPGRMIAFFLEGARSKAVAVVVTPPRPVRKDDTLAASHRPPSLLERELSMSTGGWVRRGSLTGQAISSPGGLATGGRVGLQGNTGETSYLLSSSMLQRGPALMQMHMFEASGRNFRTRFGNQMQDGTFRPASREPLQSFDLSTGLDDLRLEFGARGRQQMQQVFDPDAMRMGVGYAVAEGTELRLGSLVGLGAQSGELMPFAGLRMKSGRYSAALHVGGPSGFSNGPISTVAAELAARMGGCHAGFSYATSFRDAPGGEHLFASYVTTMEHPFSVGAGCRSGRNFLDFAVRREDVGRRTVFDQAAYIGQSRFVLGGRTLNLAGWVQWNLTGAADGRNFGEFQFSWLRGNAQYGLVARAAQPAMFFFQEEAFARWRHGIYQTRVALRATNSLHSLTSLQGVADAGVRLGWLTAGAGVVTRYRPGHGTVDSVLLSSHLTWSPFPAYSFTATALYDPVLLRQPTLFGMMTYAFGDDLPREPMLRPLRSSTAKATAFHDLNRNGVRDEGEPPLAGVEICIDGATCRRTDEGGNWSTSGLDDGWHDLLVRPARLEGAYSTGDALKKTLIGRYAPAKAEFGVAWRGELAVTVYVDANGNGRMDPHERPLPGMKLTISGPDGAREYGVDRSGRVFQPVHELGTYELTIDQLSLPPGYLAGELARATIDVAGHRKHEVTLGVTPLRSISGRVCFDTNRNDVCDPGEAGVGLIRVQAAGSGAATDEEGRFLFSMLPSGEFTVEVPELDLPGGHVPGNVQTVSFTGLPRSVTGVSVPLQAEVKVRRQTVVLVEWPRIGTATALEIAGHVLDRAAIDARGADLRTAPRDLEALREVAGLVRTTPRTRLYITVARDEAKPHDVAESEARATGEALARWLRRHLRVPAAALVVETVPPAGTSPAIDLRVYLFRGRI